MEFPEEAGILLEVIKKYAPTKSIFGVCLGQQAIAEALVEVSLIFQKSITVLPTEAKQVKPHKILENLPEVLEVGRYHSWA
jgi:anthranilate synthase component 2